MRLALALCGLAAFGCGTAAQPRPVWTLEPASNLPAVLVLNDPNNAAAVSASLVYWGPNWGWQGIEARPNGYAVPGLGVEAAVRNQPIPGGLRWTWTLDAKRATDPAIGGAISFGIRPGSGKAEIAADRRSWTFVASDGARTQFAFATPPDSLALEPTNPNEVRAFFYGGRIPAGRREVALSVTLPQGGRVRPSLDERYGPADPTPWIKNAIAADAAFIDLSAWNKAEAPAGKRGFVQARGENFVFADGTPVRFWGANVQAYSLFVTDKKRIEAQAERISRLGFNLVRLHHHDSANWVNPSLIADGSTSQKINEAALDSYFYWVSELKKRGVYVFVDIFTGRPFRPGDNVPGFEDLRKTFPGNNGQAEGKGFTHFNARLQALLHQFSTDLLTRKNPYTGLALKDDPAVMGYLLTNENDITNHFGNALLGDKGVPYHHELFNRSSEAFATRHRLPVDAVRRTWEAGPSKLWLNDVEHRFSQDWISHLRKIGVKAPIVAGHQWGGNPLFSMPAITAGDVMDAHGYENGEWVDRRAPYLLHWLAAAQGAGRPFSITEYNTEDGANARDPFMIPLATAAIGAFQGWDAPMLYGYSQDGMGGGAQGLWSSYTHPGVMGLMPAAAALFREGHVAPARQTIVFRPSRESLFFQALTPANSALLATVPERHRLTIDFSPTPELPWLRGSAAAAVADPKRSFIPEDASEVVSDTGEIRRNWGTGIQTVDTPRSQIAQGWIGGQTVRLGDIVIRAQTRKAAIAFTSLDGKPLAESARVLVSTAARVVRVDGQYAAEPVVAEIEMAGARTLTPLRPDGSRGSGRRVSGKFTLPATDQTLWWLLER